MEENAIATHNIVVSTPHEIDEDGWVNYTWIEEMIPTFLMTTYFCVACGAFYAGLF